jgi:hypothetical protein
VKPVLSELRRGLAARALGMLALFQFLLSLLSSRPNRPRL